jgi:predicted AlkP superfamily phosphohydrolase/phosphomutase/Flp pilus assembly protein TadD
LLIGWSAADWQVINPLLESGRMPHLERLLTRGVMGNLSSLWPPQSPLLWNSVSTGARADRHGILGWAEPDADSGELRPIASTSRQVKAVWNILNQQGLRPNVVGWSASHPSEPIIGVYISERYPKAKAGPDHPWELPPGTAHPQELADTLAACRVHPGELEPAQVLPFVPRAAEVDQAQDNRLRILATILAECASVQAAATWILEHRDWDFLAVKFDALYQFSQIFMRYHPPQLPGVSQRDFEIYSEVIRAAYSFHDALLGRLLRLAGPEATVLLVSEQGFHSNHLRTANLGQSKLTEAMSGHRPVGIFCMAGPGIQADELLHHANLLDVAPTILTLFGLPIGADMEGRCLVEVFCEPVSPPTIPSWESIPGDAGLPVSGTGEDPWETGKALDQLAALGYVDEPLKPVQERRRAARLARTFTLAQVHIEAGRVSKVIPLLEELIREEPNEPIFLLLLAQGRYLQGDGKDCRRLVEDVLRRMWNCPSAHAILGNLSVAEGNLEQALTHFLEAEKSGQCSPGLRVVMSRIYASLGRWNEAERVCHDTLELDEDCAEAHVSLAWVYLHRGRRQQAAEEALNTVSLRHHNPEAHYILGVALAQIGQLPRAVQALETCLAQQSEAAEAHHALAAIHEGGFQDSARAAEHRQLAATTRSARFGQPLPIFHRQVLA